MRRTLTVANFTMYVFMVLMMTFLSWNSKKHRGKKVNNQPKQTDHHTPPTVFANPLMF